MNSNLYFCYLLNLLQNDESFQNRLYDAIIEKYDTLPKSFEFYTYITHYGSIEIYFETTKLVIVDFTKINKYQNICQLKSKILIKNGLFGNYCLIVNPHFLERLHGTFFFQMKNY